MEYIIVQLPTTFYWNNWNLTWPNAVSAFSHSWNVLLFTQVPTQTTPLSITRKEVFRFSIRHKCRIEQQQQNISVCLFVFIHSTSCCHPLPWYSYGTASLVSGHMMTAHQHSHATCSENGDSDAICQGQGFSLYRSMGISVFDFHQPVEGLMGKTYDMENKEK